MKPSSNILWNVSDVTLQAALDGTDVLTGYSGISAYALMSHNMGRQASTFTMSSILLPLGVNKWCHQLTESTIPVKEPRKKLWLWRNPDNVTHRQLLSIDQIWRQSTALTWSTWCCCRLADNIWLLAHDNNNNNSTYALFDNASVASRCPVICCWVSRHS